MMKTKVYKHLTEIFIAIFLIGCASIDSTRESTERRDRNLLTKEEIESVNARNMYNVIERLRPRWLTARTPMRSFGEETGILVYQNQTRLGTIEGLKDIGPEMVQSARYLDSATATATLPGIGRGHVAGAIVLTPVSQAR